MEFRTIAQLAGSAFAHQDMNPTIFLDGGDVEPFRQPAAVTANNAITFTADPANPAAAQQVIAKPVTSDQQTAAQDASVAQWNNTDVWAWI